MAAMTIVETPQAAARHLLATDTVTINAGEDLKVESSQTGIDEMFSQVVPVGKSWQVHVTVNIIETDV